ncbi:MAG: hypothetical protein COA69_02905 [Robiginitomaculum sp.]|nr:MAG: hypothetical protein COA69_02905 [Robiginitomaculum sp.]
MSHLRQNHLQNYESALAALSTCPDDIEAQHLAVLSLVRAGSLAFALVEYERYGLDKIHHHEDVMALGGRLYKDLYLSHREKAAQAYAHQSAEKYDAAFQETNGYYSGINAATMALMADMPDDMIQTRAKAILKHLPQTPDLDDELLYFIHATRAEAYLLLDENKKCQMSLQTAWKHDPLNYTAHATTLKQFRMIETKRKHPSTWLDAFTPPKAVHFAGHMFGTDGEVSAALPALKQEQISSLKTQLSDTIQREDIGFGYGALAAGSDILIAEALVEEGCELHIILPVSKDIFLEHSVAPYGPSWVKRFEDCLSQAHSFRILTPLTTWPNTTIGQHASLVCMGEAIHQADILSVSAAQLLIWDRKTNASGTANDAQNWRMTNRPQYSLEYPKTRATQAPAPHAEEYEMHISLTQSDNTAPACFKDIESAINTAITNRKKSSADIQQGLHLFIAAQDNAVSTRNANIGVNLAKTAVPGCILVSETLASLLAVYHFNDYSTDYQGQIETGERAFALRKKGASQIT